MKLARFRNHWHISGDVPAKSYRRTGGYPLVDKAQDYLLWSRAIAQGVQIGNVQSAPELFRVNSKRFWLGGQYLS